jgi:hypothetical protein
MQFLGRVLSAHVCGESTEHVKQLEVILSTPVEQ